MKNAFSHAFLAVFVYLAAGFACALAIAFRQDVAALVLPPLEAAFKGRDAVIRFGRFFPALVAAGLLTGYSVAFSRRIPKNSKKQQKPHDLFKGAFIFCIVLVAAYAALAEGVMPVLNGRQADAVASTDTYHNYMLVCGREMDSGNFRAAYANAEAALAIWRDSDEARMASDAALAMASKLRDGGIDFIEEEGPDARGPRPPQGGHGTLELLEKAREAAERMDFYNAHYYASLSWRSAAEGDPEWEAARRIASESWNRITGALDTLRAETGRRYYERKLRGYGDIQAGDYLSAYYYFLAMKEEEATSGEGVDPDIDNFLEMARQGVLASFFFIDETDGLALFEREGGVFFLAPNDAGGNDAVLIGGVSRRGMGAADGAYFRDFEVARFDGRNELVFQISAAYAKLLPFTDIDGDARPQVVLTAVDRVAGGERIEPRVAAGVFPPSDGLSASVLDLDMPYEDMALIIDASAGIGSMSLPQLFGFARRAERYGLQGTVYLAQLIQRVAEPFIAFIMAVLALVWAHKFQLRENRPFSAWWVITMPFIAVACGYVASAARQAVNVLTMLFAARAPSLAIPISAALVVVLLIAVSAWFFAQRKAESGMPGA